MLKAEQRLKTGHENPAPYWGRTLTQKAKTKLKLDPLAYVHTELKELKGYHCSLCKPCAGFSLKI